jgi:hypothetical protein
VRNLLTVLAIGLLVGACSQKQGASGDDCTRSAQCAAGLVCVMGTCSDDLDSVVEESMVPMVGPPPGEAMADAAMSDAATDAATDAAMMPAPAPDGAAPPPTDAAADTGAAP